MPRVDGLSAKERKALMQDGHEDADPIDIEPTPAPPPPTVPEVLPPALAANDMQALIAALVTGLTQANAGTAAAIKDALSSATTMAREPIPENKQAPGISVYSHPDGDLKTPRTALKCPMFLSVYDENRKAAGAFEYHQDTLTEHERVTLNLVQPGEYWIERADDERGICLVVVQKDSLGQPIRQLIAFPQGWLATDQFAQMPNLKSLLTQLLEPQTAAA